ncbi:MAG: hypothetical protein HY083_08475 [Gammaproteobacteria bacterium]|nr:hypothetical protein [Gammaproteobacteria bacterium]
MQTAVRQRFDVILCDMLRFPLWSLLFIAPLTVAQTPPDPSAPKPVTGGLVTPVATKPAATSPAVTVTAEQWARPRSGEAVARLPELVRLVEALDRNPSQRLVVRHASGDDGTLWAEELRSWLVALGIPSVNIELAPGAPEADRLLLELRRNAAR